MEIAVLRNVQEHNDATADDIRGLLTARRVCMINVMGGAGCGKTTLLERLIPRLGPGLRCAVLEGDITTVYDAERIADLDVPVVQLQTEGSCHLDAWLVHDGLRALPLDDVDLVFVENVGNLVCPAEFDIGEHARLAVLSVMEGDDKPAKYPLLFSRATNVVLSKCDLISHTDFDIAKAVRAIRVVNPTVAIIETGTGLTGDDRLAQWLIERQREVAGTVSKCQCP
ncbi:MAG: hydrogenase nickel incorporation protein HypB [Planctomycetota bacterium]